MIDSSPLGALLKPLKEDSDVKEEATMDYLHDFVHMVYKPTVDKEVEVGIRRRQEFLPLMSEFRSVH